MNTTNDAALPLLEEAAQLIAGDRNEAYGDAYLDFRRIGLAWTALLDLEETIRPDTVAAMMAALKLVRTQIDPERRDSWADAAGYVALGYGCAALELATEEAQ